ncbi:DUF6272 family protein [Candidatus Albibeggiatoa sp. nov. NOAA]|uniref:DUF6272 family protein n=1 Tax=Candidatus Albibeggiatoa sp. nov. NOAA TaxID=3162724 RepID=UPI0032F5BB80|nr:DUF6272 family protein [Thiotrichaceae bacterium]
MAQIFGDYVDEQPTNVEHLIIGFSPTSIPLKQRWRNNGLSADFLADYLQTFFVGDDEEINIRAEIKSAVSYIANELLENAMKFSDDSVDYATSIAFHLHKDCLTFYVRNSIPKQNVLKFHRFIEDLLTQDLSDLYIKQLEKNAMQDSAHSGLGFITMIQDYGALLGWKFDSLMKEEQEINTVTTRVKLELPVKANV